MKRRAPELRVLLAGSIVCMLSCSSGEGTTGGGGSGGQPGCWDVASECPGTPPYTGAHCDVSDTCSYPASPYEFSCIAGRWGANCVGAGGGSSCVPPLGESCAEPSSTPIAGAALEIANGDPASDFVPLADGAPIDVIWGGQGLPMVSFRVRVSGQGAPDCALLSHKLSIGGHAGAEYKLPLRLHCGESLIVYSILPLDQACANPPVSNEVTLELGALGSKQTFNLTWTDAACPKGGGFG